MPTLYPPLEGEGRLRRARPVQPGWGDGLSATTVLQPHRIRFARAVKLDIDALEHRRKIGGDLGIPEPHDAISFFLKPMLSFAVTPGIVIVIVVSAIDFNDEPLGRAEKVDDVPADRRLSPEVCALEWNLLERSPK